MSRHGFCGLVVAAVLGTTGGVLAQVPRSSPPTAPAGPSAASSSKFLAIPGLAPLSMEAVQRDIRLTSEQKQRLKAVSDSYSAQVQQLGKSFREFSPEEQKTRAKDLADQIALFARNAQRKAEAVLTPSQLQALEKIAFQLSAGAALADPALQEKVGLSPEQRRKLNAVYEQAGEKMQQLQRDTAEKVVQLLDDKQAAALKKEITAPPKTQ